MYVHGISIIKTLKLIKLKGKRFDDALYVENVFNDLNILITILDCYEYSNFIIYLFIHFVFLNFVLY